MPNIYMQQFEYLQQELNVHLVYKKIKEKKCGSDKKFLDLQIGTTDSVMGLPKALTEKLIHEALGSQQASKVLIQIIILPKI